MTSPTPHKPLPCPFCNGPATEGTHATKPGYGCADTKCAGWHCWTSLEKWNRRPASGREAIERAGMELVAWTMTDYDWACLNEALPKHPYPAYIDATTKSVWEQNPGRERGGNYGGNKEMAERYTVPLYTIVQKTEESA